MPLFKANDISTFKQFVNVSFTFDVNNNFPGLTAAEDEVIRPILGDDLFAELEAQVAATSVAEEYVALVKHCRKVAAPLSLLKSAITNHIKMGTTGFKKTTAENSENIFQWEYNLVKEELLDNVAIALDGLMKYLYANATALEWEDPTDNESIIKTADEFLYPLHQKHRIFALLIPIMADVEELYVRDVIGIDFLDELKEEAQRLRDATDNDGNGEGQVEPVTDEVAYVIQLLRKAIAHYTIHKSVDSLPVKVSPQGLTVPYLEATDKTYKGDRHAPNEALSLLREQRLVDGNTYMNKLVTYLNANASAELFETYFSSNYYTSPTTEKTDRNSTRVGIVRL